jgi:hypothetical protein
VKAQIIAFALPYLKSFAVKAFKWGAPKVGAYLEKKAASLAVKAKEAAEKAYKKLQDKVDSAVPAEKES